jgi:hypothetical protein
MHFVVGSNVSDEGHVQGFQAFDSHVHIFASGR